MIISYNLRNIERLREYPEREIAVTQGIENDLRRLLREAQKLESPDVALLQQQINFIREECHTLRERRKLVIEIHEILSDSKRRTSEKMDEASRILQSLEDF